MDIEQVKERYARDLDEAGAFMETFGPVSDGEIVALASATFAGVQPKAYDSHRLLIQRMTLILRSNLWLLPTRERMPFPDAPLFAIATMQQCEKLMSRKVDWFLWIDDDVTVPQDTYEKLREAAHPTLRPFVATVGYDRCFPYSPAVWDHDNGQATRWTISPDKGVHRVAATGLACALIHRSVFERAAQPWFKAPGRTLDENSVPEDAWKPDSWFCKQCNEAEIPIHVRADIQVTHFGYQMPVNRQTVGVLRQMRYLTPSVDEMVSRGLGSEDTKMVDEDRKLIIGLGTGRCGTSSLAYLLSQQEETYASHEQTPWQEWSGPVGHRVMKLFDRSKDKFQADCCWSYLPHVEQILKAKPNTKFVCMYRDKEGYLDSAEKKCAEVFKGEIQEQHKRFWPACFGLERDELSEYYDQYKNTALWYAQEFPRQFFLMDMESLNDPESTELLLRWLGYENPKHVSAHMNIGPESESGLWQKMITGPSL